MSHVEPRLCTQLHTPTTFKLVIILIIVAFPLSYRAMIGQAMGVARGPSGR